MSQEFTYSMHVFIDDTDYTGVVYYANYLKFMEHARSSWLNHLNIPLVKWADQGIYFVIRKVETEYFAPARVNDDLIIKSKIEKIGGTSMIFQQEVYHQKTEKLLSSGKTWVVCIGNNFKPCKVPTEIVEVFNQ